MTTFDESIISRRGATEWPSCGLTALDYYLCDYLKSLVYNDKIDKIDAVKENIRRVDVKSRLDHQTGPLLYH